MGKIVVIGLGPGSPGDVTREAQAWLKKGNYVFYRTLKHPAARFFMTRSKKGQSFDCLYEYGRDFPSVYRRITSRLIRATRLYGTICYAVPGHPAVGEAVVEKLRKICPRLGISLQVISGISFLEPLLNILKVDLLEGFSIYDALALGSLNEQSSNHLVLTQVYSKHIASQVKLKLMEFYPEQYPVTVIRAAGTPSEKCWKVPLYALDRKPVFDYYSTLYLPPSRKKTIGDLLAVMARLRAPDGCPWDREQTHLSLRQYLIEEAYEVVSAIEKNDDQSLKEELGDLLLQVVFHSEIAREENRFDFFDVIEGIARKLIRRHPHVFGCEEADDPAQVKVIWEKIKADERHENKAGSSLSVDHGLPALLKAYKLQKKAAQFGFDWPVLDGPLQKAEEELCELKEACRNEDSAAVEEEMGDYLFTIVNVARFLKVNPEMALGKTISKFMERFQYIIEQAEKRNRPLQEFTLEEMD
ncbi:MAG TPA: nucleoside triphosphate pyrophosphohydrolase, partial [Firmicutes bacterium]|nr:nucleoside triphosphate pyrophosphohydrolase [Bacillota bacterium]